MVNSIENNYKTFFVKKVCSPKIERWIDINTGIEYKEIDVPFDQAQHGLCETLGKQVYKLLSKRLVLAPIGDYKERMAALAKLRSITIPLRVGGAWTFEPLDLYEILVGLDEGLTEHELATRTCSPSEAVRKLLEVVERRGLMEKVLGGDETNARSIAEGRFSDSQRFGFDLQY